MIGLIVVAILLIPLVLAIELFYTKILKDQFKPTLLEAKEVTGEVLELKAYKEKEEVSPAWLGVNPSIWIIKKSLAQEYEIKEVKVKYLNIIKTFRIDDESFKKLKIGSKVKLNYNTYHEIYTLSLFEMLLTGTFKRKINETYSTLKF